MTAFRKKSTQQIVLNWDKVTAMIVIYLKKLLIKAYLCLSIKSTDFRKILDLADRVSQI